MTTDQDAENDRQRKLYIEIKALKQSFSDRSEAIAPEKALQFALWLEGYFENFETRDLRNKKILRIFQKFARICLGKKGGRE